MGWGCSTLTILYLASQIHDSIQFAHSSQKLIRHHSIFHIPQYHNPSYITMPQSFIYPNTTNSQGTYKTFYDIKISLRIKLCLKMYRCYEMRGNKLKYNKTHQTKIINVSGTRPLLKNRSSRCILSSDTPSKGEGRIKINTVMWESWRLTQSWWKREAKNKLGRLEISTWIITKEEAGNETYSH